MPNSGDARVTCLHHVLGAGELAGGRKQWVGHRVAVCLSKSLSKTHQLAYPCLTHVLKGRDNVHAFQSSSMCLLLLAEVVIGGYI